MPRTILIVDDDPLIRQLIATILEDADGFDVVEAQDGVVAVALAVETPPAIVLMDIDMPRMDGVTACQTLRGIPATADAVIVMLTAATDDRSQARADEAGADMFITKPFSPAELLELVERIGSR